MIRWATQRVPFWTVIVLSRDLAAKNHYPAIDVLVSASRVMGAVTERAQQNDSGTRRELLAL